MIKLPSHLREFKRIVISTPNYETFSRVDRYLKQEGFSLPSSVRTAKGVYNRMLGISSDTKNFCLVLYPYEGDGIYRTSVNVEKSKRYFERVPEHETTFIPGDNFLLSVEVLQLKSYTQNLAFL